ncbi:hypothetical protein DFH09DRAFT_1101866 [Mycena vulgaris]|nr:hypothetical protein DFH09DRAFT_1101866 [Mycena vulgaris]
MAPSTNNALAATLQVAGFCLAGVGTAAQFIPVPYAQQLISLAVSILETTQRVQDNKEAFKQLATDTGEIVYTIVHAMESRVPSLSLDMVKSLDGLILLLNKVHGLALEHTSRGAFQRILMNLVDVGKIRDYRAQMRQALDVFGISVHENIIEILKELHARPTDSPRSSTSSVQTPSPERSPAQGTVDPPLPIIQLPAPQTVTTNFNLTNGFGNLVNCDIRGPLMMQNVNGDYTTQNSYQYYGNAGGLRGYKSPRSVVLVS